MYTYIVTYYNGNQDEIKAPSKKAARKELNRLFSLCICPKVKSLRKKY